MLQGWPSDPFLIAGPCVLEDRATNLAIAEALAEFATRVGITVVYKASFDKANRAGHDSPRGPGLAAGLAELTAIHQATNLPILTDVHDAAQVPAVADVADVIQIPAFLCRQTDLLVAAGRAGKPVNVKKGQWMQPDGMRGAVEKVRAGGCREVAVTERGTFFGYGDLVVDMRNFARMGAATGCPTIFDATHAVQRPGAGPDGTSGGDPDLVAPLLMAASAAGASGFFIETHPDPSQASSDGATMVPLHELPGLVERALDVAERNHAPSRVEY